MQTRPLRHQRNKTTPPHAAAGSPPAQEVVREVLDAPDMGQRGEAYFAAQLALALLVAFPPGFLRPLVDVAGWLALAGGVGLMFAGQQALGANLSPLPKPRDSAVLVTSGRSGQAARRVVARGAGRRAAMRPASSATAPRATHLPASLPLPSSSGVYGLVRHPMYGGLVLAALGLSLATADELRLLISLAFLLVLDKKVGGAAWGQGAGRRAWAPQRQQQVPASQPAGPHTGAAYHRGPCPRAVHAGVCGGGPAGGQVWGQLRAAEEAHQEAVAVPVLSRQTAQQRPALAVL